MASRPASGPLRAEQKRAWGAASMGKINKCGAREALLCTFRIVHPGQCGIMVAVACFCNLEQCAGATYV